MARFPLPQFLRKWGSWLARRGGLIATISLSLVLGGLGWVMVQWRELLWPKIANEEVNWSEMGMDPWQSLSYDVPFLVRHNLPEALQFLKGKPRFTDEAVIIYMDEDSSRRLGLRSGAPWSRALHARLLDLLTKEGARGVMFDLVFDEPSADDAVFSEALAKHGNVILGAAIASSSEAPLTSDETLRFQQRGFDSERLTKRPPLYKSARAWGLLTFRPIDADLGVRRLFTGKPRAGLDPWMSAPSQMATLGGADLPVEEARFTPRWLNYYGPAQVIESISYYRALVDDGGIPPGFFKGKYVFVGARGDLAFSVLQLRDEFRTPWARFRSNRFMPGVEIHATAFLNLLHRDWLERVPIVWERWSVLVFGLALGFLRLCKPWRVVIISLSVATALFVGACLLQWHARLWFNWAVPVLLQIPVAMVLVVVSRYYIEERQKRLIAAAMGRYLSPDLTRAIADQNFSLAPGGKKVVATMLFSDLANFTTLSEKLGDAARLSEELIKYFTRTTEEVFAQQGMVISFIGDSVFASWGNLIPQADHAELAVRAAWKMNQVSTMEVSVPQADGTMEIVPIHTRIGIHTGEVLAGNLGSEKRVDYTLIGDAVNFASRLEGANKYTKTSILLSDETAQRLGGKFLLRRVGAFMVKGKKKAVVIHELLGLDANERPPWLDLFESALTAWTAARFPPAREAFTAVIAARGGADGPSQFYLDRIDKAQPSSDWTGAVSLEDK